MKALLYTRVSAAEQSPMEELNRKVLELLEKYCAERQIETAGTHTRKVKK